MTTEILDFLPREQYDAKRLQAPDTTELTTQELFDKLYERSLSDLSKLLRFYKSAGGWNTTSEQLMQRVSQDIKTICASVAGEKNGSKV